MFNNVILLVLSGLVAARVVARCQLELRLAAALQRAYIHRYIGLTRLLYMYFHICKYIYTYMPVRTSACSRTSTWVETEYIFIFIYLYICMYIYLYYMYIWMYIMSMSMSIYRLRYIFIYNIYVYVYMYLYTCMLYMCVYMYIYIVVARCQ